MVAVVAVAVAGNTIVEEELERPGIEVVAASVAAAEQERIDQ